MGLFFGPRVPDAASVELFATALQEPPPAEGNLATRSVELAGARSDLAPRLANALAANPPTDPTALAVRAASTATAATQPAFYPWRGVIAAAIFVALVAGGVVAEHFKLNSSSGALFGFAGGVFGVVTAFLGAEKGSS